MRTNINLDEDAHELASYYARAKGITLGAAISELIRTVESAPRATVPIRRHADGFPMFQPKSGKVTAKMIKDIEANDFAG